jgi:hypothetical protein
LAAFAGSEPQGLHLKTPVPGEREANRLHGEAVKKKKKDAAEEAAARKRKRKEEHAKACKIAHAEGKPRPATPESTEEEDSLDVELNFSDDDEAATGAGSPPVYRGAGGEDMTVMLGEARLTSGSLVEPPPVRTERGAPTPAAGRRSPTAAAGGRSSTPVTGQRSPPPAIGRRTPTPTVSTGGRGSAASAETPAQTASGLQADPRATPSGQSSGGVSVPRARRSGTGKRSMSARSG